MTRPKRICKYCNREFTKASKDSWKYFYQRKSCQYKECKKKANTEGAKGINLGEKNGQWKGNKVKFNALHDWVKYHKKKARECEFCGECKKLDLANISGKYERNIEDYKWLCRSCHTKFDFKNGTRKMKVGGKYASSLSNL